jgi:serine/threonine protein kinase
VSAPATRTRLGAYEPLLALAAGGMARVYVARQVGAGGFERLVVIKRIHRHLVEHRSFHDALLNEARIASHVHHPNVVAVTDVIDNDGELLLVMPYVESVPLSQLLYKARKAKSPLAIAVVVRILADVLAGLHGAHEAVDMRGRPLRVVHRDVSPENILVGMDGATRLIDFGVAKASHALEITGQGLRGKYAYMAPEQTTAGPIDRRADVFAAGIVLHEALTGRTLFASESTYGALLRVQEMAIPLPSSARPGLPPALEAVTMRALSRPADQRFPTAEAFLHALEEAARPANASDVAELVEREFGEQLEARRAKLRSILDGAEGPNPARVSRVGLQPPDDTGADLDPAFAGDLHISSHRPPTWDDADLDFARPSQPDLEARWRKRAWVGATVLVVLAALGLAARLVGASFVEASGPPPVASVAPATPPPTDLPPPAPALQDETSSGEAPHGEPASSSVPTPASSSAARRLPPRPAPPPKPKSAPHDLQPDPY